MTDLDADRVARLIAASESNNLSDLAVYAMFVAVRADAVLRERERQALRLESLALEALRRGETDVARALGEAAEGLTLRSPRPADVADA